MGSLNLIGSDWLWGRYICPLSVYVYTSKGGYSHGAGSAERVVAVGVAEMGRLMSWRAQYRELPLEETGRNKVGAGC